MSHGGRPRGGDQARRMWTLFESVHAVTYFAPQGRAATEAVGLRGFWRGYFASRAAPLGPVDAGVVTALFFNFAPATVRRALPNVWTLATPEQALRARQDGATAALREVLDGCDTTRLDGVVALLEEAVAGLDCAGRGLGAANAALPLAEGPLARLWQAATTLREHRGDGHVAALLTAEVDGAEALVWRAALDGTGTMLQGVRGWTDEEWAAAGRRLTDRGWLDGAGAVTAAGRDAHREVEDTTDRLAYGPWRALGADRTDRLAEDLEPLARAAGALLPFPNPIGLRSTS